MRYVFKNKVNLVVIRMDFSRETPGARRVAARSLFMGGQGLSRGS